MASLAEGVLQQIVKGRPRGAWPPRPQRAVEAIVESAFGQPASGGNQQQTTSESAGVRGRYISSLLSERMRLRPALEELRSKVRQLGQTRLGNHLTHFIKERFPATRSDKRELQRMQQFCRNVLASRSGGVQMRSTRSKPVPKAKRRRASGGGRHQLASDIGVELFHWFVDTIRNVRCRIRSSVLLEALRVVLYCSELLELSVNCPLFRQPETEVTGCCKRRQR